MKPFLALIGGFLTACVLFVSGAAFTMNLIMVKPATIPDSANKRAALWTSPAARPDNEEPRMMLASLDTDGLLSDDTGGPSPDTSSSASRIKTTLVPAAGRGDADMRSQAHVDWCSRKYRSYQAETDSYLSYSGQMRPCVSPYVNDMTASVDDEPAILAASSDMTASLDDHAQACMNRYRSYRVEDNTYQPYGGGPRRQCQ